MFALCKRTLAHIDLPWYIYSINDHCRGRQHIHTRHVSYQVQVNNKQANPILRKSPHKSHKLIYTSNTTVSTLYRAMAISISFMFGRIGGVVGSNFAAYLLKIDCHSTFNIYGGLLLGKKCKHCFIIF